MVKLLFNKAIVLSVCLSFLTSSMCSSQTKSVDLDGLTVVPIEYAKHRKKVRTENAYLVFSQHMDLSRPGNWDSTFFLTKFPKLEETPIRLHSAELTLMPFDTSFMDVSFVLFQVVGTDTTIRTVKINEVEKIKKKKLLLHFTVEDNLVIHPGEFFMGYNFRSKAIPSNFNYRIYSSARAGEGLLLTIKNGSRHVLQDPNLQNVFPFMLSYEKM